MTNRFSLLLKKYSIPALFFVAGLVMLFVGIRSNQGATFMLAAILMFAAGAISILYSSGKLKPMFVYIIGIVAGVLALITIYVSGMSIYETTKYMENYKKAKSLAIRNLDDVRYIQKAYADKHGTYLSDWDALIDYTKTGTVPYVDAQGVVPDRRITVEENKYLYKGNPPIDQNMSEDEAYRLSLWKEGPNWTKDFSNFRRDTIEVSIMETKFMNKAYRESREKQGFYAFSPDSLPIIPFTKGKEKWLIETRDSVQVGDKYYPAIRVSGKIPFASKQGVDDDTEEIHFGSLTTNDVSGSWENE